MENNNGPGIENPTNKNQPYNYLWTKFNFEKERIKEIDLFRSQLIYKINDSVNLTIHNGDKFMSVRIHNVMAANTLLEGERRASSELVKKTNEQMEEILAENGIIDPEPQPEPKSKPEPEPKTTAPKEDVFVERINEEDMNTKNENLKKQIATEEADFAQLSKMLTEFREPSASYITTEKFQYMLKIKG